MLAQAQRIIVARHRCKPDTRSAHMSATCQPGRQQPRAARGRRGVSYYKYVRRRTRSNTSSAGVKPHLVIVKPHLGTRPNAVKPEPGARADSVQPHLSPSPHRVRGLPYRSQRPPTRAHVDMCVRCSDTVRHSTASDHSHRRTGPSLSLCPPTSRGPSAHRPI